MTRPDWAPTSADEPVVWQGQPRRRVVHLGALTGVAFAAGFLAVGLVLARMGVAGTLTTAAVATAAAFGVAVPTAAAFLWRKHTHYLLTESGLYHRSGVLWITVTELSLDRVQNTAYSQGVFGTMFDHGTVTVETAGSEEPELRLRQLNDPGDVHQVIAARAEGSDGAGETDDIPGTTTQWRAVLEEVRRLGTVLDQPR